MRPEKCQPMRLRLFKIQYLENTCKHRDRNDL